MQSRSKAFRRVSFARLAVDIIPPCGCQPRLIECRCPEDRCSCCLDVEIIDPRTGGHCMCRWVEADANQYYSLLGDFLARVDPANYATPPTPSQPITSIDSEVRIATLESRHAAGLHLYHPKDISASDDDYREGDLVARSDNGVARRAGVGRVEETAYQARWSKEPRIRVVSVSPI